MSRDAEVRRIAADLQVALAELNAAVNGLEAVLLPPEADASQERMVAP